MPQRAAEDRGDQLAVVAGVLHEKLTSDELGGLLGKLEQELDGEDYVAATNVREVRREHDRAVKVPTELVKRIAKATALARDAWVPARKDADFPRFAPHLETLLDIPELDGIQWVPGAGNPGTGSPRWFPTYRRIQEKGKLLVLQGMAKEDVEGVLRNLSSRGLLIETRCDTESEARELLARVAKWTRG